MYIEKFSLVKLIKKIYTIYNIPMADIESAFNTSGSGVDLKNTNEWNRIGFDECNKKRNDIQSEKPLKYRTNNLMSGERVAGSHLSYGLSSIHPSDPTNLRNPELTNERYIHQLNMDNTWSEIQPYEGNGVFIGSGNKIDSNSDMRAVPARVARSCNLAGVEIDRFDFIDSSIQDSSHIVPEGWVNGGTSTRNDFRKLCNSKK